MEAADPRALLSQLHTPAGACAARHAAILACAPPGGRRKSCAGHWAPSEACAESLQLQTKAFRAARSIILASRPS
jgi:hypothetical protein